MFIGNTWGTSSFYLRLFLVGVIKRVIFFLYFLLEKWKFGLKHKKQPEKVEFQLSHIGYEKEF